MQISPELKGLSLEEVQSRVSLGQVNRQDFASSRSILTILRANLFTLFNAVVGGAFLVLLILGYWKDALFGLAVIINILIGIIQEYRSKRILDKLTILSKTPVLVRRAGNTVLVPIENIVIDDLLELKAGDQLPTDAKLLNGRDLELDESPLTGESEPVAKNEGEELLSGSIVTSGSALVQVTRVGSQTYSSKLVSEARKFSQVSSEIRTALNKVIIWISWALFPVISIVLYGQLQATVIWEEAVVRAVASVISMVPQGLVLITSIAFAISATRLAKQKVLLQELAAVEGLARVDVVCIDKTGTLTSSMMVLDQSIELEAVSGWQDVLGEFANLPGATTTTKALQNKYPARGLVISNETEFNSTSKYGVLEITGVSWMLGAPEVITKDVGILNQVSELAQAGMRTLLLATKGEENKPVALLALKEEIRPEAHTTLEYLKTQGVMVRVLSGDHPQTVAGIAREVGLSFQGEGFDSRELPQDIDSLAMLLEDHAIFGRVTPEQKKFMIQALQKQGHTVAMIGDGVNDALALKQADLGIAMGSGSPATRAVANLVLLDNRFESLPKVVAEGRSVIANVERLSRLFLTKTTWAIVLAVVFGLSFWEFPFLPRQLSAVDGFTIGMPAFLLALLPNHERYRPGFLARALKFCIPAGIATGLGVIVLGLVIQVDGSWVQAEAQTATAMLLSVTGLWVLSSLDRPDTRIKYLIHALMLALAILMFTLPLTRDFFGFVYLSTDKALPLVFIGAAAVVAIEVANWFSNRAKNEIRT
jgi:cation-transporting ATPase E